MFDSCLFPWVQPSLLPISLPCASSVEFWRNSHLGTVTWRVRGWINVGKVQQKGFSERFIAQVLSHKCLFWVPFFFAPCASQGIEQGILGTVILKLPIGSPCDGHQEQGKDRERTTCSAHCGWGGYLVKKQPVDLWLIQQTTCVTSKPETFLLSD